VLFSAMRVHLRLENVRRGGNMERAIEENDKMK
jgi:hypothetical protein